MSWVSDLIKGRNGKASLTKIVGWLAGLVGVGQTFFPTVLPHDAWSTINSVLVTVGGIAVKNAIDKTAPPGSPAAPQ